MRPSRDNNVASTSVSAELKNPERQLKDRRHAQVDETRGLLFVHVVPHASQWTRIAIGDLQNVVWLIKFGPKLVQRVLLRHELILLARLKLWLAEVRDVVQTPQQESGKIVALVILELSGACLERAEHKLVLVACQSDLLLRVLPNKDKILVLRQF